MSHQLETSTLGLPVLVILILQLPYKMIFKNSFQLYESYTELLSKFILSAK